MPLGLLLLLILQLGAAPATDDISNRPPLPKPYPTSFSISFVTNITSSSLSSSLLLQPLPAARLASTARQLKNYQHANKTAVNGNIYYDYMIPAQRIDHGPGSYECLRFYNHSLGCSLIFLNSGMYRILHYQSPDTLLSNNHSEFDQHLDSNREEAGVADCCLDSADLGPLPPNWASSANPTYNGIVFDDYSRTLAHQWSFDNLTTTMSFNSKSDKSGDRNRDSDSSRTMYHIKREAAFGEYAGRPLLFTFPSAVGRQDMHYIVDTMRVGPQRPLLFRLPDDCVEKRCEN